MKAGELIIPCGPKKLFGVLELPGHEPGPEGYPLVICSHGFDGSYAGRTDYVRYLADAGYAAYCFDFYGGGRETRSGGTMEEMSVLTEAEELTAVLTFFRESGQIDPDRITLWGNSQGGFVSTVVAGRHPELVRDMILLYPAYVICDNVRQILEVYHEMPETYTLWDCTIGKIYGEDALSVDIYGLMEQFPGNVLIVHGDQDDLVPVKYSEQAVDTFPAARLTVLHGAGHGFEGEYRQQMMELAVRFLQERDGL